MGRMPHDVLMSELNLFWQHIFTWGSWAVVAVMLIIAWRLGRRYQTPFYIISCVAVGVGAFNEPLYDVAFDLWFYDVSGGKAGAMFSHFTAFNVAQPYWTHSGYIILYGMACLYAGRMMYEGRLSAKLWVVFWLAEIGASCVFEMIGTGMGVYSYYGPYVLRLWNYPLIIGVLEGTQTMLYTLVAVHWWRRAPNSYALLGLLLIFPVMMLGVNVGLGGPVIIAMHLSPPLFSMELVWAATLLSIALCGFAIYMGHLFLPKSAPKVAVVAGR